jgi:alkanesulfonate monooxygenase SsuD/methylene tetrahydromethanopterin reductase-like flavin-dependent oxidoreductase (luciferase family)
MWSEEYYEEHSEFLDFPKRMVTPRPFQDPHPPCWMAAVSEPSAATAGENGLGMLAMSILKPVEELAASVRAYREASARCTPLTGVRNNRAAAYTLVVCVEKEEHLERDKVWDAIQWWFTTAREFTLKWEVPELTEEQRRATLPYYSRSQERTFDPRELAAEDMIIVGTVDECLRKLKRYQDIGIDQTLCYAKLGPLENKVVMRSIELLGREVIPELDKRAAAIEVAK